MTAMEQASQRIEETLKEYQPLQDWLEPLKEGDTDKDPWLLKSMDPIFIKYESRTLCIGFSIVAKEGEARVVIEIPFRTWREGLERITVTKLADKAIALCEYCWSNQILQLEGTYPSVLIKIEL